MGPQFPAASERAKWVSVAIINTNAGRPAESASPCARRGSSSQVALLPTPSLDHNVFIPSVSVVETGSTVLSVWIKETSPGDLRDVPARPVSLMLCITLSTTSWFVPRLWSRTPLLLLMLPPSDSGMKATMPYLLTERRDLRWLKLKSLP